MATPRKTPQGKTRVTFELDSELIRLAKLKAGVLDRPLNAVLDDLLKEWTRDTSAVLYHKSKEVGQAGRDGGK